MTYHNMCAAQVGVSGRGLRGGQAAPTAPSSRTWPALPCRGRQASGAPTLIMIQTAITVQFTKTIFWFSC